MDVVVLFQYIAALFLIILGVLSLRVTQEKVDRMNEKITDPNKKKSVEKIQNLGKGMIGGGLAIIVVNLLW